MPFTVKAEGARCENQEEGRQKTHNLACGIPG